MSTNLHIKLFGEFYLAADGLPITGVNSERLQALLAFIVLHRHGPQSRQQVAVQLWPEATDTDAKANLRRRLHELKRIIPDCDRRLRVEPKTIQWVATDCQFDVAEFETAIAQSEIAQSEIAQSEITQSAVPQSQAELQSALQAALEQAAKLYQGDLLPSCYDDWIVPHRERLRQCAIAGLERLVTQLTQQGESRLAIGYAQQLQRLDPLSESAYCHLMRLYAQEGDRASALRVYHQCMTTLQEELGVNPSPTTCQLYEELLTLDEAPSPPVCVASSQAQVAEVVPLSAKLPQPQATVTTGALPLIGREAEWAAIQDWRSHCLTAGSPDLLWLVGEPGIGKTRLLEELAKTMQAEGASVLWGRGFEAEMLRPYGVWVDIFQSIGAIAFLDELKSLVLNVESAATLNRGRLFDLVAQFITQLAATAPVLVVLDDIQWLDETSIAFLHYAMRLLSHQVPVWFACAARKREITANLPADRLIQALHREHRIRTIELEPLGRSQTLALAQAVGCNVGCDAECDVDCDRIFTSSGGNPLFALEIMRAQVQSSSTADTLETLIQGRLRQLDDAARDLVSWAAALGRSFNPTTLAQVAGCPLPRLLTAIDQLEQHGIIRPGSAIDGEIAYDFAHDIVRQVAYEQFSEPRRKLIHTHIAQALTAIAAPTSSLINDVAHHADLGSDHALAATACWKAAERCLQVFAYAEAAELSQRGLSHCHYLSTPERVHLQLNLLKAAVKAGVAKDQVIKLRQDLQALIQEAAALGQTEDESAGLEALIALNYDHGNLSEVERYSLRAAERVRTASPTTTMQMLAHSGSCLAEIGRDMPRAEALLIEAQSISHRLGLDTIDISFGLGCVRRYQGEIDEARSHLRQGWQMAQVAQDHWRECTCLMNLVMLELEAGNPMSALDYGHELICVSAQMGGGSEAPHAAALDAVTHYLLQEQHAAEALEQACQVLQQIDSPRILAYVQTLAAQQDLQQGNLAQAVARAEMALEAAQVVDDSSEIAIAWSVIIQASHQRRNYDCAQRHFSELRTRLKDCALSAQAQQCMADLEQYLAESAADHQSGEQV